MQEEATLRGLIVVLNVTLCTIFLAVSADAAATRHAVLRKPVPKSKAVAAAQLLAFPGAMGWAATTPGGRGGQIIKVTTLVNDGPGSLRAAIDAKGPRIVVFEVGGVIDLDRRTLTIREPHVTIAGQTAPSPGITLIRLYAHNYERNVLMKGGTRVEMVNNLIFDPGQRIVHYNLMAEEWGDHAYQLGQLTAVGNVAQLGQSSPAKIVMMKTPPLFAPNVKPMPSSAVQDFVLHNAGARPWDRDYDDVRLIADVAEGRGTIINSENDIRGYPVQKPTQRPFNPADWDLIDMTPKSPSVLDSGSKARGT